jgi:hypothetical protein
MGIEPFRYFSVWVLAKLALWAYGRLPFEKTEFSTGLNL